VATHLRRNLIEALVKGDTFDRRFEQFAAALMSVRDGIQYTTTSATGDLGRDAYARSELVGGVAMVCATTQSTKIKQKAEDDVDRLAAGPMHIVRLQICISKELSEKTRDQIRDYALEKLPQCDVDVHGATQVTDLAFRYQTPFLDHYERDLDVLDVVQHRKRDVDDERENPVRLLRVALATVFDSDVISQRDHLLATLVLMALEDTNIPTKSEQLCQDIGKALRLTDVPVGGYLNATLLRLADKGLIVSTATGWALTEEGRNHVARLTDAAADRVLDGRVAFLNLLRLGGDAPEQHDALPMTRLWQTIQKHMSMMFLNSGLRLVDDIREMAASPSVSRPSSSSIQALNDLVSKIKRLDLPERLSAGAQAVVIDMLIHPGSDGFKWLSELAAKYLVICALGLDPELERRITERVRSWQILPDTHVILAYLSVGDERYEQAMQLFTAARRLDAKLIFAESALEEAVHHAELAKDEFEQFRQRVQERQRECPQTVAFDVIDYFDNAFIKGFARESGATFIPSHWTQYISQFISRRQPKTASLAFLLKREFADAEFTVDDAQVLDVGKAFAAKRSSNSDQGTLGANHTLRLQWDGRLMATSVLRRSSMSQHQRLIILTDSESLRNSFKNSIQADKRVGITLTRPASLAAALMLVPNTSVNLECVRLLLFDELRIGIKSMNRAVFHTTGDRFLRRHGLEQRIDESLLKTS
jgi:hypothetical protein